MAGEPRSKETVTFAAAPFIESSPLTSSNHTTTGNTNVDDSEKLSRLLDVPLSSRSIFLNDETNADDNLRAELEEAASRNEVRKKRRRGRLGKFLSACRMNLFDCFMVPDELPEVGKLSFKTKVQFVLQSRGVFWFTLFVLVLNILIFSWEFNQQEWEGLQTTILTLQLIFNTLFATEIGLRIWVSGVKNYFRNAWHLIDFLLVAVALISVLFCSIIVFAHILKGSEFYICNFRHLIILRLIPVVQRLSEDDLQLRVEHDASQLDVHGLTIASHELRKGRKLGAGAFAEVYLGLYSGTLVAVKVLHDTETENSEAFHREVNILTLLRHPNIVLFMGVVDEADKLWFITEYCAKGSLNSLLGDEALFPSGAITQLTLQLAVDICRGMAYLHGHKRPILHRDLKTANVLVSMSLEAKVSDFGESVIRLNVKKSSPIVGTVQYTAPEVLRAEEYAAPADIYSLGVVLWEMASKELPYRNKNLVHVGYSVGFEGLRPDMIAFPKAYLPETNSFKGGDHSMFTRAELSERRSSDVIRRYRELVERCWDEEPELRPSASACLSELESIRSLAGCSVMSIEDLEDQSAEPMKTETGEQFLPSGVDFFPTSRADSDSRLDV
ncbi:hypothetical protein NDN08_001074 [Rhodosorus marinus]|uniref:Protein kinase domain-containing protein n=1 Tax=Rhodosorus marinus TaxID=101924 RepID=A0AAV8UVH0_9RHOD|nr:hypothetical protein NDN08_001074 [Rhodosorus marinus]